MADAPEIKVKLTAEDTGVAAAIKELGVQLKNLKTQEEATASSAITLGSALRGIASAGAVLEFGLIGKAAFDSAVNIGKMADKTGLSTQTLSVFHHVAEELGVSTETVDKSLVKAARSVTLFEQGSKAASQGFALLGIKQKDFIGLNADQKVQLVTERLGNMASGLQKTTAAQLIFSKGGADFIPIANAIAGEGFDKITASVSKLGLLLTRDMTDSAQAAKASIQELQDAGAGFATQFEAGILPAVSDVAEALSNSLTQGGVDFKQLGQYAGDVVRGISLVFLGLGQFLGTIAASIADSFTAGWQRIKIEGTSYFEALGQAARGHLSTAYDTLKQGARESTAIATEEEARQQAIWKTLGQSLKEDYANLFPSPEEEARRQKERVARLRPEKTTEAPQVALTGPNDAAEKAGIALLQKQLEDQLAIRRAYAKQTEEIEKEQFDRGLISLEEYFSRRRAAVLADAADEVAILEKEKANAQAEADKAAAAAKAADTPKDKDKEDATRLQSLAKVDELQTKIAEAQIARDTKTHALNIEEAKAQDERQKKLLTFQNELLVAQGKTFDAQRQKIIAEGEEMKKSLAQAGRSSADVDQLTQTRLQTLAFEQQQKSEQDALQENADKRDEVQNKVKTGQLFEAQGEEQIREIERERLAILQAIAKQLEARAETTGADSDKAAAAAAAKNVDDQNAQLDITGQRIGQLKETLQTSLTGSFATFFETVGRGTETVARSFENLAGSVVRSLEQMAAKMLAQIIITKLLKSVSSGFGFGEGGAVGGGASVGAAGGGLIKGPGGPQADAIPARLSAGEFVVKASAVSAFGAHNLEAINRGIKPPTLANLALPKFAEGGLVGGAYGPGSPSSIELGIGLDQGLILHHLSSKDAGRIILNHLTNNPKAAGKALGRSQS